MQHEAYLYRDKAGFVDAARSFIDEGTATGEAVLVATSAAQIDALRSAVAAPDDVQFADMATLGRNPTRIISVWRKFVRDNVDAGRGFRGIGEPIWADRTAAELVECQRHEVLLNLAFADGPSWRLMCPYNVSALPVAVINEALASHPIVGTAGLRWDSSRYQAGLERLDPALPPAPPDAIELAFTDRDLALLRDAVASHAAGTTLDADRIAELVLVVHEVAVNSIQHGGGRGVLRVWLESGGVVCDVSDDGWVPDPLAGREEPQAGSRRGRGLWLANEWCDLVQWRSSLAGTQVRMHMAPPVSCGGPVRSSAARGPAAGRQ